MSEVASVNQIESNSSHTKGGMQRQRKVITIIIIKFNPIKDIFDVKPYFKHSVLTIAQFDGVNLYYEFYKT